MSILLEGLAGGDAHRAAELTAASPVVALAAGESRRGASLPTAALYVVEDGFLVVYDAPSARRPVVTAEAGPGAILLPPRPGELLHAIVDSRATALSPAVQERLLAVPAAARAVCARIADALRLEQEALAIVSMRRHAERVRRKLLQLGRDHGRVDARGGVRLTFPLTHELLAEMVGSARETVSRAVEELERGGFLAREGRRYRLHVDPEDLALDL